MGGFVGRGFVLAEDKHRLLESAKIRRREAGPRKLAGWVTSELRSPTKSFIILAKQK